MKFELYVPQAIHQLGQRKNQEDSIYPVNGQASADDRFFLVCDGMGGHDKGEVASAAVCQGLSQYIAENLPQDAVLTDELFERALQQAFDSLDAADLAHEGKMGTTMTFLCLHKGGCLVAHIGDSRIYHLRPQTGQVLYRSRDHSLVQQLYELGEISYNEMGTSQRKNIILRAMQPYQEERTKATVVHITDIRPGDYFYLCSDGMLEQMEDDELLGILKGANSDEEKVAELVRRTEENADNHSAYLIHVKDVEHEAGDELLKSDEEVAHQRNKALHDDRKDLAWDGVDSVHRTASGIKTYKAEAGKPSGGSKKKYILPLVILLLALGVGAFLLFGGKGKTVESDEDDATTEMVDDEQEGKEPPQRSIKEEAIEQDEQQRRSIKEPDQEPQPLNQGPQPVQKDIQSSKFGYGVNY